MFTAQCKQYKTKTVVFVTYLVKYYSLTCPLTKTLSLHFLTLKVASLPKNSCPVKKIKYTKIYTHTNKHLSYAYVTNDLKAMAMSIYANELTT